MFIPVKICQKGFSQEKSDSPNLLLYLMKRIKDAIILKLISLEKLLLPNNKTWTNLISLLFRISELIEPRLSKKTFLWLQKLWQSSREQRPKSVFQNTDYEGAWQIEVSSLFCALTVWSKKELLKVSVLQKLCLCLLGGESNL